MDTSGIMLDYFVHYQSYNSRTKEWDYKVRKFNSEIKAKQFGAEILRVDPNNSVMIRSRKYKIIHKNGSATKNYIHDEINLMDSSVLSYEKLMDEVKNIESGTSKL